MDKKEKTILIGEYYASKNPTVIYTLLGSCVAVCLFDPVEKIGGMNHILLPGKADLKTRNPLGRYSDNAIDLLFRRILNLGGVESRIRAKVYGGAHLFQVLDENFDVGWKNATFALDMLQKKGINVVCAGFGGQ